MDRRRTLRAGQLGLLLSRSETDSEEMPPPPPRPSRRKTGISRPTKPMPPPPPRPSRQRQRRRKTGISDPKNSMPPPPRRPSRRRTAMGNQSIIQSRNITTRNSSSEAKTDQPPPIRLQSRNRSRRQPKQKRTLGGRPRTKRGRRGRGRRDRGRRRRTEVISRRSISRESRLSLAGIDAANILPDSRKRRRTASSLVLAKEWRRSDIAISDVIEEDVIEEEEETEQRIPAPVEVAQIEAVETAESRPSVADGETDDEEMDVDDVRGGSSRFAGREKLEFQWRLGAASAESTCQLRGNHSATPFHSSRNPSQFASASSMSSSRQEMTERIEQEPRPRPTRAPRRTLRQTRAASLSVRVRKKITKLEGKIVGGEDPKRYRRRRDGSSRDEGAYTYLPEHVQVFADVKWPYNWDTKRMKHPEFGEIAFYASTVPEVDRERQLGKQWPDKEERDDIVLLGDGDCMVCVECRNERNRPELDRSFPVFIIQHGTGDLMEVIDIGRLLGKVEVIETNVPLERQLLQHYPELL